MSGTEILVGGVRAAVVGTVSMDALAVRLPVQAERGAPVTLVGDGVTLEQHAASRTPSGTSSPAGSGSHTGEPRGGSDGA